jgi:parallel beta-helix repeat protein
MKSALFVAAALALATSPALAAVTCPDSPARPILLPEKAGQKCQKAIAKEASKFAATRMAVLATCMQKQVPGLCPEAKDTSKIEKAADKAAKKITKACGSPEALAGLATSYASVTDGDVIQSCTLSQHTAWTSVLLGLNNGTPGEIVENTDRDKCAKELSKQGNAYLKSALGTMNKCFKKQMKSGTPGADVSAVCVPSWGEGALILPSDAKTASSLEKLAEKTEGAIAKKCTLTSPDAGIESLFACPGAETVEDLQTCIICENQAGAVELFTQQNGESFQAVVSETSSPIQSFVDAASAGDTILVLPGTYQQTVRIQTNGLELVGCGAATNDRPVISQPTVGTDIDDGIRASAVDGLVFQSLEVFGWPNNGIFVEGADGVTFRDVIGDGGDGEIKSIYAIYPVRSSNVLVEACVARNIADAGIYVGEDVGPIVRYNTAEDNVAGIEIENSEFALVYGNYATNNTGGLLVFKLPGPTLQVSNDHEVFDNVLIGNNTPNFGASGSSVGVIPDGTGMLILSNDTTDFHHNIVQGNDTFGIALIDQDAVNALSPGTFNPPSPEQSTSGNTFRANLVTGNGNAPDTEGDNGVPADIASNIFYLILEAAPNCFEGNVVADGPAPIGLENSVCPPVAP